MFQILKARIETIVTSKQILALCILMITYHSLEYNAKHNMSSIQPLCLLCRNEKLRPVCIFAGIGHRQPPGTIVLQLEVLIGKPFTIDALA